MSAKKIIDKQREKKILECPCCGKQRALILEMPLIPMQERFSHPCLADRWAERLAQGSFYHWGGMQWACNHCLHTRRALAGRPWLQTFCDWPPYLAYFDRTFSCEDCHNSFVFSAQEQQYWYEKLKFWVQSVPKQCPACRRERREKNEQFQLLQTKLKELPEKSHLQEPQQLLAIASLYLQIGSYQKASEYVGRAKNRAQARGELDKLAEQIATLKERIQEQVGSST